MDRIQEYCSTQGYADHVVRDGLRGLVESWEKVAASVGCGEEQQYEEYLNDLDGRRILEEVLPLATPEQVQQFEGRIHQADELFRLHTKPVSECLWGKRNADRHGWTPDKEWWYYRKPLSRKDG